MARQLSDHHVAAPIQAIDGVAAAQRQAAPTAGEANSPNVAVRPREAMRRREFQVDESTRQVAMLERMIADFERLAADLDREIVAEQERSGIRDPGHFAYSLYAKATTLRRDNLKHSADMLRAELAKVKAALQGEGGAV